MEDVVYLIEKSIKKVLSDKINRLTLVVLICFGILLFHLIKLRKEIREISTHQKKTEQKVDFRYFNTTRSLQDIFNVEIETKQGRVINNSTRTNH